MSTEQKLSVYVDVGDSVDDLYSSKKVRTCAKIRERERETDKERGREKLIKRDDQMR